MAFVFTVFIIAGLALAILLLSKRYAVREKRSIVILELISKGDGHLREYSAQSLNFYSNKRERLAFLLKKQLPLKAKLQTDKALEWVKSFSERQMNRIANFRNSRDVEKPDNISEFFKSIAEVEKGRGEIQEPPLVNPYEEPPQVEFTTTKQENFIIEKKEKKPATKRRRTLKPKKVEVVEIL